MARALDALSGEAERTATRDALDKAIADPQTSHEGLIKKLSRELSNFSHIKLRVSPNGQDTILQTVQECDRVLGNLFDDVQSGRISKGKAWWQLTVAAR